MNKTKNSSVIRLSNTEYLLPASEYLLGWNKRSHVKTDKRTIRISRNLKSGLSSKSFQAFCQEKWNLYRQTTSPETIFFFFHKLPTSPSHLPFIRILKHDTMIHYWFSFFEMLLWQRVIPLILQMQMLDKYEYDRGNGMEELQVPGRHWPFFGWSYPLLAPTHLLYSYTMWSPPRMNVWEQKKIRQCKNRVEKGKWFSKLSIMRVF